MKHFVSITMLLTAIGLFWSIVFLDLDAPCGLGLGICAMILIYWVFITYDEP